MRFPPAGLATAVFGVILIAGVWVATTNRAQDAISEAIASEFRKNQNLALALDVQTHQLIKGVDQLVLVIKGQYERRGPHLPLDQLMPPPVVADESFTFIGVVDERGDVLESLHGFAAINIADREMFQAHQARDTGDLLISAPVLGRISGRWAITLSRRINHPDGSFGGVANISIEPRYLTEIFESATLGPNDMMSLVLLNGITLARRRGAVFEFGVDISGASLFRHARASRRATTSVRAASTATCGCSATGRCRPTRCS